MYILSRAFQKRGSAANRTGARRWPRRPAGGLDGQLSYAQVARLLGRPTSTIAREVARNGGRGGYRPDRAHRSTEERARRSSPLRSPAPDTSDGPDAVPVRAFEAHLTEVPIGTGLPRMMSRVLAALSTTTPARWSDSA